jgi:hypothetical protein
MSDSLWYNAFMHEKLTELWRQRPFKPFKLQLTGGKTYVVRRPEHFMVLKSSFYLGFPKRDRFILRDFSEIAQIRSVQTKKTK